MDECKYRIKLRHSLHGVLCISRNAKILASTNNRDLAAFWSPSLHCTALQTLLRLWPIVVFHFMPDIHDWK